MHSTYLKYAKCDNKFCYLDASAMTTTPQPGVVKNARNGGTPLVNSGPLVPLCTKSLYDHLFTKVVMQKSFMYLWSTNMLCAVP